MDIYSPLIGLKKFNNWESLAIFHKFIVKYNIILFKN